MMINSLVWTALIVVFLVLEAATSFLVSIWFAGGALAALVVSLFVENLSLEILVFLLVSLLCVAFVRKIAMKHFKASLSKTNLDRIIGQHVIVKEDVDNMKNQGSIIINDVEWKVKSENGEIIQSGETVEIADIQGVKLIVRKED